MSSNRESAERSGISCGEYTIVVALTLLARVVFFYLTEFTADDAFITFRYAENIAAGYGFVYNIGQHVLGTTTPLFTLFLALVRLIGIAPIYAALIISLIASAVTASLLYRLARYYELGRWSWLVAITYALWPRLLVGETCGMESALFTMLVVAAFYMSVFARYQTALLLASASALTRPEGLAVVGLILIRYWFDRHKLNWRLLISPVILLGSWYLFAWFYFGALLPNSIPAKLALYGTIDSSTPLDRLTVVLGLHHPLGWIFTAMSIAGAYLLYRAKERIKVEILWVVILIAFYSINHTVIFFWYLLPLYPYMILFAIVPVKYLAERTLKTHRLRIAALAVTSAAIIIALTANNIRRVKFYTNYQVVLESCHKAIGQYLNVMLEPDELVAAEDIGYIGYYSGRTLLDRDGLVSPEVVAYNREGRFLDLILDYDPVVVVTAVRYAPSAFVTDQRFLDRYRLERVFARDNTEYHLYRLTQNELDKP